MADSIHTYTNDEVTIVWQPNKCIHSRRCFTGLPSVFDPNKRPWVTPTGADSATIISQVQQCPSGALSMKEPAPVDRPDIGDINAPSPEEAPAAQAEKAEGLATSTEAYPSPAQPLLIEVTQNGPYLLHGPITVQDKEGNRSDKAPVTALCRCGFSANKPYCDGSHARMGFVG